VRLGSPQQLRSRARTSSRTGRCFCAAGSVTGRARSTIEVCGELTSSSVEITASWSGAGESPKDCSLTVCSHSNQTAATPEEFNRRPATRFDLKCGTFCARSAAKSCGHQRWRVESGRPPSGSVPDILSKRVAAAEQHLERARAVQIVRQVATTLASADQQHVDLACWHAYEQHNQYLYRQASARGGAVTLEPNDGAIAISTSVLSLPSASGSGSES